MATLREVRRNLWLAVAGSWAASAGVVAWCVVSPVGDAPAVEGAGRSVKRATENSKSTATGEAIDPKSAAWSRKLRQPLFDAPAKPAPAATVTAPAPPPIKIKLLGTLAGGARPSAILQVEGREAEVREPGEALASRPDATVLAIESKRVTLKVGDQELSLSVEEPKTLPLRGGP